LYHHITSHHIIAAHNQPEHLGGDIYEHHSPPQPRHTDTGGVSALSICICIKLGVLYVAENKCMGMAEYIVVELIQSSNNESFRALIMMKV
jgi:hypothetical protein